MSEPEAAGQFDETLFRESLEQLRSPRPLPVNGLVSVVLMLVFAVGVFADLRSVTGVVILVAAVAFHEAGHALGMRVFGFRDVRMFFVPFFGAAVSGRARGAAAWKSAVVSLLGPLPGIVAGLALLLWATEQPHPHALTFQIAQALLLLNVFNLLPLGFLDGGRFFERVLFSRHRMLDVGFAALGSLALLLLAVAAHMWMLALFAALPLGGLPRRWRLRGASDALRATRPAISPDPDQLGDEDARDVFTAARAALGPPANQNAASVAEGMESLLGSTRRAPGVFASLGLLLLYAVGAGAALVGVFWLLLSHGTVQWERFARSDWSAEFPRAPVAWSATYWSGGERDSMWRSVVHGTERYTVTVREGGEDGRWQAANVARVARDTKLAPAGPRDVTASGRAIREWEFHAPDRVLRLRMFATTSRRYEVAASAPRWGEDQQRFLDSFTLGDSASAH